MKDFTGLLLVAATVWLLFLGGCEAVQRSTNDYAANGAPIVPAIQTGIQRLAATPAMQIIVPTAPQAAPVLPVAPQPTAIPIVSSATAAPAMATLPTAQVVVLAPTLAIVVPDASKPIQYAAGSNMQPTPLPTIAHPTPLTAGKDYQVSADGKCVTAPRNGKLYRICQDWKYTPAEAASVGDYLHTGLVSGEEVTQP